MAPSSLIAVVDDDPSIRTALSSLLRSAGYRVQLFEDAESFLAGCAEGFPDCIVTDIQMERMNGLELIEALQGDGCPPVIVITAFPEPALRQRAMQLGAAAFLSKPFDAAELLEQLGDAID